jgi:hypothetical protein
MATEDRDYDRWMGYDQPSDWPQSEMEELARDECERRGIDPDEICADGGVTAWMVVAKELAR